MISSSKRTIQTVIGAALIAMALGGVADAGAAGSQKVSSEVTLKRGVGFAFKGQVKSSKPVCQAKRFVRVYRKQPGPDFQVTSDTTDSGGRYVAEVNQFSVNTFYYSIAAKRVVGDTVCKAAQLKLFIEEE